MWIITESESVNSNFRMYRHIGSSIPIYKVLSHFVTRVPLLLLICKVNYIAYKHLNTQMHIAPSKPTFCEVICTI